MKKLFYLSIAAIMIFTLSNCATNHTVTNNTTKETDSIKLLKVKLKNEKTRLNCKLKNPERIRKLKDIRIMIR